MEKYWLHIPYNDVLRFKRIFACSIRKYQSEAYADVMVRTGGKSLRRHIASFFSYPYGSESHTAYHCLSNAVRYNHIGCVIKLLQRRIVPNTCSCQHSVHTFFPRCPPPLIMASWAPLSTYDIFELLLKHGEASNILDSNGISAIHYVASRKDVDFLRLLIVNRADINVKNKRTRKTPIEIACDACRFDNARFLLFSGADVSPRGFTKRNIIHDICSNYRIYESTMYMDNAIKFIRLVLIRHLCINSVELVKSNTPLHFALQYDNSYRMVEGLLQMKASVNKQNRLGQSPLLIASNKSVNIVELLVRFNANIHIMDFEHNSPIHIAYLHENIPVIRYLISQGANVNLYNCKGFQPKQYIETKTHVL